MYPNHVLRSGLVVGWGVTQDLERGYQASYHVPYSLVVHAAA